MIIDITNELYTKLKTELVGLCNVYSQNQNYDCEFPCVILQDTINTSGLTNFDSGGEKYNDVMISFKIYSEKTNSITDMNNIRNKLDEILTDELKFTRITNERTFESDTLNSVIMRYTFKIDKNNKIYRRI
jgi:hypothetical protein